MPQPTAYADALGHYLYLPICLENASTSSRRRTPLALRLAGRPTFYLWPLRHPSGRGRRSRI